MVLSQRSVTVIGAIDVQSDSAPAVGVQIDLFNRDREVFLDRTETDSDGRFTFSIDDVEPEQCFVLTYIAPENLLFSANTSRYLNRDVCVSDPDNVEVSVTSLVAAESLARIELSVQSTGVANDAILQADLFLAKKDGTRASFLRSEQLTINADGKFYVAPGCYVVVLIAPETNPGSVFTNGSRFHEQAVCVDIDREQSISTQLEGAEPSAGVNAAKPSESAVSKASGIEKQRQGAVTVTGSSGQEVALYGDSYALIVGVSDYTNGWDDLDQIPAEIELVQRALEDHGFKVIVHLDAINKTELERIFQDFRDQYGYDRDNRILVFYAGHGHSSDNGNIGYLVGSDAPLPVSADAYPGEEFLRKSVQISQMMEWASQMAARHVLFLFDSCFSGTVFRSRGTATQSDRLNVEQASLPVRQFITAGSAHELVPAKSVFVPKFVEAISTTKADFSEDGYVTARELGLFLKREVPQLADQTPQYGTHLSWDYSRGDFVFVLD